MSGYVMQDNATTHTESFSMVGLEEVFGERLRRSARGSTVVKVLCYKSEGRLFDPSWCQWIFN